MAIYTVYTVIRERVRDAAVRRLLLFSSRNLNVLCKAIVLISAFESVCIRKGHSATDYIAAGHVEKRGLCQCEVRVVNPNSFVRETCKTDFDHEVVDIFGCIVYIQFCVGPVLRG